MQLVWANEVYLCGMQYTYIIFHECGSGSHLYIVLVIMGGTVSRNSPITHGVDSPGVKQCEYVLWLSGQEACRKW